VKFATKGNRIFLGVRLGDGEKYYCEQCGANLVEVGGCHITNYDGIKEYGYSANCNSCMAEFRVAYVRDYDKGNDLVTKIQSLKLSDDSSGLKQNAMIDKIIEIIKGEMK